MIDDDTQLTELVSEFMSSKKFTFIPKHTPEEGIEYCNKNEVCVNNTDTIPQSETKAPIFWMVVINYYDKKYTVKIRGLIHNV